MFCFRISLGRKRKSTSGWVWGFSQPHRVDASECVYHQFMGMIRFDILAGHSLGSLFQGPSCVGDDVCSFLWKLGSLQSSFLVSNLFQVRWHPWWELSCTISWVCWCEADSILFWGTLCSEELNLDLTNSALVSPVWWYRIVFGLLKAFSWKQPDCLESDDAQDCWQSPSITKLDFDKLVVNCGFPFPNLICGMLSNVLDGNLMKKCTGLDVWRQVSLLPPLGSVVVAAVASSLADYLISKGVDITFVSLFPIWFEFELDQLPYFWCH